MTKEEIYKMAEIGKKSCNLFHDVLNPISGLLLYLETIQEKDLLQVLQPAKESAEKISNFIKLIQKDIYDISDNEKIISINSIALDAIKIMRNKAIINKTSLILIEKNQLQIIGNELKTYQIFINLISNAIDACANKIHKNKKGRSRVIIKIEENQISVIDNGDGIKKENLPKIFQKNFTTKQKGFGIGLYSTKNIIEDEWGGKILVKSKIGEGSEFIITLPCLMDSHPH